MAITILFDRENHRAFAKSGAKEIGESTFSPADKIWIIDHTAVDEDFGGQGIAEQLVDKVAEEARKEGVKLTATCPYAKNLFETKKKYQDVLL